MIERLELGPNVVVIHAGGPDPAEPFAVVEWLVAPPPAPGPPLHRHRVEDEAFYVLDGALDVTVDDATRRLPAGAYAFVPRGTWHTVANPGPAPCRFLALLSPPGLERLWQATAALLREDPSPPSATLVALQERHGMQTLGGVARRFG